jgi:hypothetical protein
LRPVAYSNTCSRWPGCYFDSPLFSSPEIRTLPESGSASCLYPFSKSSDKSSAVGPDSFIRMRIVERIPIEISYRRKQPVSSFPLVGPFRRHWSCNTSTRRGCRSRHRTQFRVTGYLLWDDNGTADVGSNRQRRPEPQKLSSPNGAV